MEYYLLAEAVRFGAVIRQLQRELEQLTPEGAEAVDVILHERLESLHRKNYISTVTRGP
tara:strand:+ start:298 stop:474 length:177 start_codon:yes stop_codon:yes gene_type:complete